MTSAPELRTDPVLDLRGLQAPTMRLYPVVDHIADKLCATQAVYGASGERRSSRVRDLVDLVVLARSQDVDGAALIAALRGEWTHRGLAGTPVFDPPAEWERRYPPEARRAPVVAPFTRFEDAVALVGDFLRTRSRRNRCGPAMGGSRARLAMSSREGRGPERHTACR